MFRNVNVNPNRYFWMVVEYHISYLKGKGSMAIIMIKIVHQDKDKIISSSRFVIADGGG